HIPVSHPVLVICPCPVSFTPPPPNPVILIHEIKKPSPLFAVSENVNVFGKYLRLIIFFPYSQGRRAKRGRREKELVAGEMDKESGNCTIIPSHPAEKRKHDRDEEEGKKTIETKKARLSSKNKKKTSLPIGKIILRNPRGRPIIRRPAATEECREGWITGTGAARSKETAPQIRSTTGGRVGARHYNISMLI
ncbi:hypothetical protein GWI33_003856, partial [Rhynchophorus ferrugineus]